MKPFFRPEAVDAQRLSWLGGVRLIRPLSMSLLTVFTVGVAALVIAYLFVGEYTRTDAVYWFLALLELIRLGAATVKLDGEEVLFAKK